MAAAQGLTSVGEQLQQLGNARSLVLADPVYWPQVLHGILPIVSGPVVELRRWGAEFLAETFSTPVIEAGEKLNLAITCLDTMVRLMDETETGILKSVVQCSASVYPLIFRYICNNRDDAATWKKMNILKSKILSLWDSGPVGVRLCCIKFVQRVVLVQSRGATDPRLADKSEISLSMVPTNHPVLSLPALDAEAQGLLDRLLSVLHEDPRQDPLSPSPDATLITATLNNLAVLVKTRNPIAGRILSAVLSFNPLIIASRSNTLQSRMMMQCMEKTVRVLLLNIVRANPGGPYTGKVSQHLTRLSQMKSDLLGELSRKRAVPPPDNDAVKRLKMEQQQQQQQQQNQQQQQQQQPMVTPTVTPPPAPPQQDVKGPMSYAELYTLSTDVAMTSFDGQQLPLDLVLQIIVGSIYSMNQHNLDVAITAVRSRHNALLRSFPAAAMQAQSTRETQGTRASPLADEPPAKALKAEDGTMVETKNKTESEFDVERFHSGKFRLPPPPVLTKQQRREASMDAVMRMFDMVDQFDKTSLVSRKSKLGINRVAASTWDRDGWVTMIARLATRGLAALHGEPTKGGDGDLDPSSTPPELATFVREKLYEYIMADFRDRTDVAAAWLNEEWYNDKIMEEHDKNREPQYMKWMTKVMDGIFPFLEGRDRLIIRLLSEIPEISYDLLQKVKMLCLDPDRASLGIQILHYLAMLRPPVRNMCMDILEDLWLNHAEVRGQAQKLLQKWRPSVLVPKVPSEESGNMATPEMGANGNLTPDIPQSNVAMPTSS